MGDPFIGSEAVAAGKLTPYQLRSGYTAIHRDVYTSRGAKPSAVVRGTAAWLWPGRAGVVAGRSASALHGANWVDDDAPAEILYGNRRPPSGIRSWSDRHDSDEVMTVRGVVVTTPARTAFDIACRFPLDEAVASIDALARATRFEPADVDTVAERYRGRRGARAARAALALVDAGAESPQETRVRLLLIRAGFPPPETQIAVFDEWGQLVAELDMGWRDLMVGVDYEGGHHRRSRHQVDKDIRRHEAITELGWNDVRVTAEDTDGSIVGRVARARARRT
jgi:hypothetical protein